MNIKLNIINTPLVLCDLMLKNIYINLFVNVSVAQRNTPTAIVGEIQKNIDDLQYMLTTHRMSILSKEMVRKKEQTKYRGSKWLQKMSENAHYKNTFIYTTTILVLLIVL